MTRNEIYCPIDRRCYRIKWRIEGFPGYAFAENKRLYNLTTFREIRPTLKGGYTIGYHLKGKFYSQKQLRQRLFTD